MGNYNHPPRITFKPATENEAHVLPGFLLHAGTDFLKNELENCLIYELYEEAIIYRDELVRRQEMNGRAINK